MCAAFPFHMLSHAILLHLAVEMCIPYGQHFLFLIVLHSWVAPFFAFLYQVGSWYGFSVIWYYLSFVLPDGYQMGNCSQCLCPKSTPEPMGMGLSVS